MEPLRARTADALFLVAGTGFQVSGLREWAQVAGNFNPLFHCVNLVRHAVVA